MPLTLGRIIFARLAGRRSSVAPLFGAFLMAIALLVVLPEMAYLSASAAFQTLLHSLPSSTSTVQIQNKGLMVDSAIASFQQEIRQQAATQEHGYLREGGFRVESGFFPVTSHNGASVSQETTGAVLEFVNHTAMQSQADLVSGTWPAQSLAGSTAITLSDSAASGLHAKAGDLLCISNGREVDAICLFVSGVWRPKDSTSPYWIGDYALPAEAETSRADLYALTSGSPALYQATDVLVPDLALIDQSDPATVQDSLAHLRTALGGTEPDRTVTTGLDSAVADFNERSRIAGFALELITAQLWLVGLYSILFLVGIRLEQDHDAVAVWRTRGWSRRLVATLLSIELLVVATLAIIPGAAAGFGLAVAITRTVYPNAELSVASSFSAEAPVVVAGLLALGVAVIALAIGAARVNVVRARAEASRPQGRWWNRPWVAVAAFLVAIPILAEARVLGDARIRAAGGSLPYDVALPGLGMVLIAYAGITLIPYAARAFALVAPGLVTRLAAMQLARSSGRQQRLSLLLAAAVALALLAAAYSGTQALNASDRAAYAAGADLRVVMGGDRPADLTTLQVGGAAAKSEVFRAYARPGSSSEDVPALGVDPYTFGKTAWTRPGLMSPDLVTLMRRLVTTEVAGTLLPAEATNLSIWVYGAMTGGSLTASFTDADMMPVRADFGSLNFSGWKQLSASFAPAKFKSPLRLRHLTVTPVTNSGTIAISELDAIDAAGSSQTVYGFDNIQRGLPEWWISDGSSGARLANLVPDDRFPRDGRRTTHVFLNPGWLPVMLTPPARDFSRVGVVQQIFELRVPFLVSNALLGKLGVKVGDSLSAQLDGKPVNGLIAGSFDYFPTIYGDGLVYSLPPLIQVLGEAGHPRPWPSELWVSGSAPRTFGDPRVIQVVSRQDLERRNATDPLGAAGRANLFLGFAAACVLGVAGFAIHFAFAARSRRSEYAILQANGLSPGQVARSLLVEELLVAAFSTVLGLVVGAVLSLAILPDLQVSTSFADTIPPTVLAVNPWLAFAGIGITVAACLVAGALVARSRRAVSVMPELRALG